MQGPCREPRHHKAILAARQGFYDETVLATLGQEPPGVVAGQGLEGGQPPSRGIIGQDGEDSPTTRDQGGEGVLGGATEELGHGRIPDG